ncbi:hypothetical protein BACDOR_02813 [Phocaeicola dorei DSM 17855]|uniref:Uncharacterized protein n=1 Tax=Phocaeicola dorei DSM 17855 TaxID=483217 RepID=B6VZT9_9BACT|nr:hypothetical protein BACDOR_02813 [Phocaeicola dorei DSM 17855]
MYHRKTLLHYTSYILQVLCFMEAVGATDFYTASSSTVPFDQ